MVKIKVLSTKKLLPSLVEQAKQNHLDIIEQEYISIKPVWSQEISDRILNTVPSGSTYIALTSAVAIEVLSAHMTSETHPSIRGWKIYCLSGKTKQAILESPLSKNIVGEAGTAAALAEEIIRQGIQEILFLCSNQRRDELPDALQAAGIKLHEVVVYESSEVPVAAPVKDLDALLFFSPSGVRSFFAANRLHPDAVCFAIGPTTAKCLGDFTRNRIVTSTSPDPKVLVEAVFEYFKPKILG